MHVYHITPGRPKHPPSLSRLRGQSPHLNHCGWTGNDTKGGWWRFRALPRDVPTMARPMLPGDHPWPRNQQAKELRLWSFQVVSFLYLPRAFQWVKASCFVKTPWKTMLLGVNAIFTLLDTILDRILYHLVSQFCECHMPKAMRAWTPRGVLWDLLSRGSVVASLHLTRFTQANVTVQDAMLSQGAKALLNCAMTWTFRHCETLPATRSGTTWDHWKLKSSVKRAQSNGSRVLLSWIQCARQQSPGSPVHSDLVA